MRDKILAVSAYLFWIPSIYIVLSKKRKESQVGEEGGRALLYWTILFTGFFLIRFIVNLLWLFCYIPYLDKLEILFALGGYGYILYCGYGVYVRIDNRMVKDGEYSGKIL